MSKRAFWPGLTWRILAHHRTRPLSSGYTTDRWEIGSGERWGNRQNTLEGDWELDEVVIDGWLHLEQMDNRDWWLGIGDPDGDYWHVNVHVDAQGRASVTVEKQ